MIYLSIILYIVCVVASFDFYLMHFIVFAIGHAKFSLIMINKIKVFHMNLVYIGIGVFCLCAYLGLVYYNLSYFKSWVISKEEIIVASKIKSILLLNFIILLNIIWMFRITISGKKIFRKSINIVRMLDWLKDNLQNKRLIFKIARYLDKINDNKSDSLYLTFLMFTLDDKWLVYENYKILIDGNVIKIKDKNNNIYAFNSYHQLLTSNLVIPQY